MSNHLIIGLGGTGGKVLRELRKRIYEEFRSNDPGNGVFMDYIYVDSSPADLNDRSKWKVLGKPVHLGEAQKVNINGINASMVQNLNMYPGLQSFINTSDKQLMLKEMGPLISAGIGGQRCRLGRMLIANNLSDKDNKNGFMSILLNAVNRLQTVSNDQNVTFHICAGLAGGTGSGSIVDVVSQIRSVYNYEPGQDGRDAKYSMRLFVYIPEKVVVFSAHDNGYYQANGYAALQELNAISTGFYHPTDVTGTRDPFSGEVRRLLEGQEVFEAAYVYSNVNEQGKMLDLAEGLPSAVADFMFQSIIVASMGTGEGKMARLVGCENDGAGPERDQSGAPNRSRKFLSFGISRVEYPETEVGEYMAYTYAKEAVKQLMYNMWLDGIGYGECSLEEVGSGFLDEIKNPKNREALKLATSYLTLGRPIIETPNTQRWKEFNTMWETRATQDAGLVQQKYEKKQWFGQFTKLIDGYFEEGFRGHGVNKFYEIQTQEIPAFARHIRRHIERILFEQWEAGGKEGKSILEIQKYATLLRNDCNDRIAECRTRISKLEDEEAKYTAAIKQANIDWGNIGWLIDAVTNASSKTFERYKTAKYNYYLASTRIYAYNFAIRLLQELIIELGKMIEGVEAVMGEMAQILENVCIQAASKCKVDEKQDEDTILKKYDPEKVRALGKQYAMNYDYQNNNASEIRRRMTEGFGEDVEKTFAKLYEQIDEDTASDIIIDICTKNSRIAMDDTAKNDPLMKMVGVNILDKLAVEFNTDEKLETFVKNITNLASTYVQFNGHEKAKVIGDNDASMQSMVQVSIPKGESESAQKFRVKLINTLTQNVTGFVAKTDVSENYKPNQIVVVCANSGFPLRYLDNLRTLKEKYDMLLAAPKKDLNKMVLHTESFDKPLPPLFEADAKELATPTKKNLLLAFAMNIVQAQTNPTTGATFYALNIPDDVFGDRWEPIGKDFGVCVETITHDFQLYKQLEAQVESELPKQARSNDQKKVLSKALGDVVQKIILPTMCENNQFDKTYIEYRSLAVSIINEKLAQL